MCGPGLWPQERSPSIGVRHIAVTTMRLCCLARLIRSACVFYAIESQQYEYKTLTDMCYIPLCFGLLMDLMTELSKSKLAILLTSTLYGRTIPFFARQCRYYIWAVRVRRSRKSFHPEPFPLGPQTAFAIACEVQQQKRIDIGCRALPPDSFVLFSSVACVRFCSLCCFCCRGWVCDF